MSASKLLLFPDGLEVVRTNTLVQSALVLFHLLEDALDLIGVRPLTFPSTSSALYFFGGAGGGSGFFPIGLLGSLGIVSVLQHWQRPTNNPQ